MRVLGRIRLSRASDESTSPERQKDVITTWASQNDHTIIGWAEDLDVSGAVDPFDTPALGPWLTDKLGEWDILCAWKLDRLARRAVPLHRLFGLCQDEGKTLVCVSDNIDLSSWVGRLVASVIAGVAEGELEAIRERTKASHQKLRELGRWPGGKPAYGYRAVEREDAAGWELVPDEHAKQIIGRIVADVLAGRSVESIAQVLTDSGELSPSDYLRARDGNPTRGNGWHSQTIRKLLRSRTLLGHVTHKGQTVRDGQGNPIRKGPPLVTQHEFDQIQAILQSKSFTVRTTNTSPLLGVVLCPECGKPLHHRGQTTSGKLYRYYYCRGCRGAQVKADEVEDRLEEAFLYELGDEYVRERVFIPAENHQIELDEAIRAVDEISAVLGTITSDTMRKRLTSQLSALDSKISRLESLPSREAGTILRETDTKYRTVWENSTTEQRRELLLASGITATIKRTAGTQLIEFHLRIPEDIKTLVTQKIPPP